MEKINLKDLMTALKRDELREITGGCGASSPSSYCGNMPRCQQYNPGSLGWSYYGSCSMNGQSYSVIVITEWGGRYSYCYQ